MWSQEIGMDDESSGYSSLSGLQASHSFLPFLVLFFFRIRLGRSQYGDLQFGQTSGLTPGSLGFQL
jgi:hypothetical protein